MLSWGVANKHFANLISIYEEFLSLANLRCGNSVAHLLPNSNKVDVSSSKLQKSEI